MPRTSLASVEGAPLGIIDPLLTATGLTFAYSAQTLGDDFRVPAGEIVVQSSSMLMRHRADIDSNMGYAEAELRYALHYHATTAALQTTWLTTHLENILGGSNASHHDGGLLHVKSWLDTAGIHEVTGGPEASFPVKNGNVITVEVVGTVLVARSSVA